jgi:hypothetical protein
MRAFNHYGEAPILSSGEIRILRKNRVDQRAAKCLDGGNCGGKPRPFGGASGAGSRMGPHLVCLPPPRSQIEASGLTLTARG